MELIIAGFIFFVSTLLSGYMYSKTQEKRFLLVCGVCLFLASFVMGTIGGGGFD
jgi:hypothetical protein